MVFDGPLFDLFNGHLFSGECGREADHPAGSTRAQDWRWSLLVEVLNCPLDCHQKNKAMCQRWQRTSEAVPGQELLLGGSQVRS